MRRNKYSLALLVLAASVGCGGGGGGRKNNASIAAPDSSTLAGAGSSAVSSAGVASLGSGATIAGLGSSNTAIAGGPATIPGTAISPTVGGTITAPPSVSGGSTTTPTTGGTTTTPTTGGTTTTPTTPTTNPTTPTRPTTPTTPTTNPTQPTTPTAPAMAKGSFKAAASLGVARGMHTATTLADGRVLAIGGFASAQQGKVAFVDESELYDPLADAWTKVSKVSGKEGLMRSPWGFVTVKRVLHTATKLADGRVLITGGYGVEKKALLGGLGPDVVSVLETAHVFDPRTNKFIHVGSMGHPRYGHTATLMSDGRVLIAGGYSPGFFSMHATLAPIEIFDPKTNRFSTPGFILPTSLEEKRQDHAAVALDNGGGVLLIGGQHYTNKWLGLKRELVLSASGEVFSSNDLTSVGNLAKPRRFPAATLLNGQAVVMGGDDMKNVIGDIEVFDRTSRKFVKKGALEVARTHGAAASSADYALLIGGFAPNKGEIDSVDAFDGTKTITGLKLANKRNSAAVAELKDGRVLVTGGFVGGAKDLRSMDGRVISSCEVYSGK